MTDTLIRYRKHSTGVYVKPHRLPCVTEKASIKFYKNRLYSVQIWDKERNRWVSV